MSTSDYRYGKPKTKKIDDHIDPKYFPPKQIGPDGKEIPYADDPATRAWMMEYAHNAKEAEQRAKLEAKRHEEEQRKMQEYEKKQREQSEQMAKARSKIPERQLQRFISGEHDTCYHCKTLMTFKAVCSNPTCQAHATIDIEPLMTALRKEIKTSIKLDEQTRQRLVDFAKPDETWPDLMNRILDIAEKSAKLNTNTIKLNSN